MAHPKVLAWYGQHVGVPGYDFDSDDDEMSEIDDEMSNLDDDY